MSWFMSVQPPLMGVASPFAHRALPSPVFGVTDVHRTPVHCQYMTCTIRRRTMTNLCTRLGLISSARLA